MQANRVILYRVVVEPLWGNSAHKAVYRRFVPPLSRGPLPASQALRQFDEELETLSTGYTVRLHIPKR